EGRSIAGQTIWPHRELTPLGRTSPATTPAEEAAVARTIAGQPITSASSDTPLTPLDVGGRLIEDVDARSVAGQQVLARSDIKPSVEPQYMIGEERPSILISVAIFDAREALELGALELTIGRLTSKQLTGYRLLADATLPY